VSGIWFIYGKAKSRFCVTQALGMGQTTLLDHDQSNCLFGAIRLKREAQLLLFNGVDGEYLAGVAAVAALTLWQSTFED
jgi:16S rRNA U1498 N3-methylase RsmE